MIFIDLDKTLIDTKALLDVAGPEPIVGTPEHATWLAAATDHDALRKAEPVFHMRELVEGLVRSDTQVAFVTNRREDLRNLTVGWLKAWEFSVIPLLMRENNDSRPSGDFKESAIKVALQLMNERYAVVIDDDDNGTVQAACLRNGWVFLKAIY